MSRPVVGWYAHHVGAGHVTRAHAVARLMSADVTILSSAPRPDGWPADRWVDLARDDDGPAPSPADDLTAGGTLHWAPLRHNGYRDRMATIADWVAAHDPALVVVDVSTEVTLLARLLGVPVAAFLMPGDRADLPHQLAYSAATALFAPWPRDPAMIVGWRDEWEAKTQWLGALSRHDGVAATPLPDARTVTLLTGAGGFDTDRDGVAAAIAATPEWTWTVCDGFSPQQVAAALASARVVVAHAGQNAIAEIAAARRPAVIIAQRRPHDEQACMVEGLARLGLARAGLAWPTPEQWPAVLEQALPEDPARWSAWSDGAGADRCAAALDLLANGERP